MVDKIMRIEKQYGQAVLTPQGKTRTIFLHVGTLFYSMGELRGYYLGFFSVPSAKENGGRIMALTIPVEHAKEIGSVMQQLSDSEHRQMWTAWDRLLTHLGAEPEENEYTEDEATDKNLVTLKSIMTEVGVGSTPVRLELEEVDILNLAHIVKNYAMGKGGEYKEVIEAYRTYLLLKLPTEGLTHKLLGSNLDPFRMRVSEPVTSATGEGDPYNLTEKTMVKA